MRVYVTARFKNTDRLAIEALCSAIKASGLEDFCFIRDVEQYQKIFNNPHDLWTRSLQEIKQSDALLIDVSDQPSGGRVVEVGIAFALGLPIIVVAKRHTDFKDIYKGVAANIYYYDDYADLTPQLASGLTIESQR